MGWVISKGWRIRLVLVWSVFFAVAAFAASPAEQNAPQTATEECDGILLSYKPRRGTLEYYTELTRRSHNGEPVTPKFVNPKKEVALAQAAWRGIRGPKILQELLPEDCRFIDHKLLGSAGDGIVKDAGSGEFVMLRCAMKWNDQWVGFNISVPVSSLLANAGKSEKWLVGEEAEAVLDWGHGGGTKTTGNHTSIGIMNHLAKFGVAAIAIDQPWHGEGPRNFFRDEKDFFAFRKHLLNKFVHHSVPVVGVGHSMGGIFSDMMMRRSDDQHLDLGSRYKGFISLSGVVDLVPGGSLRDKSVAERWKEDENKTDALAHRIAPGDRELGSTLLQDDKISALSGVFVNFMNLFHDWTAPSHGGAKFLPALYIWGDSDYLYVGNEALIDSHLLNLSNVNLKVYGIRVNFKGDVVQVGHLIFDHYRTQKDHPAAQKLVERYLEIKNLKASSDTEVMRTLFFENFVKPHVSQHYWMNTDNRGFEALMLSAYYWDQEFQAFVKDLMAGTDIYKKAYQKVFAKTSDANLSARAGERAYMLQFTMADTPETYTLIREEIERLIGKKLEVKKRDSTGAVLANLLQTYSANLAFRQWLENYDVLIETATDKFRDLNDLANNIRTFTQARDWLKLAHQDIVQAEKAGRDVQPKFKMNLRERSNQYLASAIELRKVGIPAPLEFDPREAKDKSAEELAFDKALEDSIKAEQERIANLRKRSYVPPSNGPVVLKNIADRERLNAEITKLREEKEGLRKRLDAATNERNALEFDLRQIAQQGGATEVVAADREVDARLEYLVQRDEAVRLTVEQYMMELYEQQRLTANVMNELPEHIQIVFDEYERASQEYQRAVKHLHDATALAAERGHLGTVAKDVYHQLHDLRVEVGNLSRQINEIDGKVWTRQQKRDVLLMKYTNELVPGYLVISRRKVTDLMASSPENWPSVRGVLENAWADWKLLWKERPPADKVELY